MQTKHRKITIKSYLDFANLLQSYRGNHEQNRIFALKHESRLKKPRNILLHWFDTNLFRAENLSESDKFIHYSISLNNLIGFLSILIGFIIGIGLLSYSGKEPVNIIYYMFFAIFIPLVSMLLTLFSMFSKRNIFDFFTLFLPFYWLEKLLHLFSFKDKFEYLKKHFSPNFQKWMFINRVQLFSLLFSIGLFLALLFIVVSQDVAFSWSTTIKVDASTFHSFIEFIASPWSFFFPSFVPSVELVDISQHYRLGEKLDSNLVAHADKLGEWWKYLAMNTIFYAILLRFLLWLTSNYGLQKELNREFFKLEGVSRILREFKTPFVSMKSPNVEKHLKIEEEKNSHIKKFVKKEDDIDEVEREEPIESTNSIRKIKDIVTFSKPKEEELDIYEFHYIIGWNFIFDELILINDSNAIKGKTITSVGGNNSFEKDEEILAEAKDRILIYVKSWEPPTMDFIDFLEELIENKGVEEIEVFPLGTADRGYQSSEKEFAIWNRKIESLESKKVWVIDAK